MNRVPNTIPGHGLRDQGAAFTAHLERVDPSAPTGPGHALCTCGTLSADLLASQIARRQWHRQHKLDMLNAPRQVGDLEL